MISRKAQNAMLAALAEAEAEGSEADGPLLGTPKVVAFDTDIATRFARAIQTGLHAAAQRETESMIATFKAQTLDRADPRELDAIGQARRARTPDFDVVTLFTKLGNRRPGFSISHRGAAARYVQQIDAQWTYQGQRYALATEHLPGEEHRAIVDLLQRVLRLAEEQDADEERRTQAKRNRVFG